MFNSISNDWVVYYINILLTRSRHYSRFKKGKRCHSFMAPNRACVWPTRSTHVATSGDNADITGYRMVFASICEYATRVFIFASTSIWQAVANILQARASEHPCNFGEQFEQRPNFASSFKLNETILSPYMRCCVELLRAFDLAGVLHYSYLPSGFLHSSDT